MQKKSQTFNIPSPAFGADERTFTSTTPRALNIPSPALSVVGRHNSGKTTLLVKLIEELVRRGHDVGSVKHHHHAGFEIDIPGKDSYRQRAAGAIETVISCPGQMARIQTISGEAECADIVASMPNHDVVLVEGYRKSGLPTIEIMRAGNEADAKVAEVFAEGARRGWPLGVDFTQIMRALRDCKTDAERERTLAIAGVNGSGEEREQMFDSHGTLSSVEQCAPERERASNVFEACAPEREKLPTANTKAVVTDLALAREAASAYGIPAFDIDDVQGLADFIECEIMRPKISVVIQAGGESRRMGQSKATVSFNGRPLIERIVSRVSPVADELIITTNEPDRLEFLHSEFPQQDIKLVRDLYDYRGALPGICTALTAAILPYVALVACDMVNASAALIAAEAIALRANNADAVVPVNSHGFEPFHALYRRDVCLAQVQNALDAGERRAQSYFSSINVYEFSSAEVQRVVPGGGCFANCNTPEELHALERAVED